MHLLLFSLATWRITSLFSREEGPFRIFERFRNRIGVKYDEMSNAYPSNSFAEGLICQWCSSVWWATGWAIFAYYMGIIALPALLPSIFAYSAGAILIDEVIAWLEHRQ